MPAAKAAPRQAEAGGWGALFGQLESSEMPLSAKTLFCLCEGATPDHAQLVAWYSVALEWASVPFSPLPFFFLVLLPLGVCVCFCCCSLLDTRMRDTTRYDTRDRDLL